MCIHFSFVVPYNPYLSLKFNCHINVEYCANLKSVKYLYKYVYKGHDRANVEIAFDEIKHHMDTRYVSAQEAAWRLLENSMHEKSHTVIQMPVHLPAEQQIFWDPKKATVEHALGRDACRSSKLTKWFELNTTDPNARNLLYCEVGENYVWKDNIWQPRKV